MAPRAKSAVIGCAISTTERAAIAEWCRCYLRRAIVTAARDLGGQKHIRSVVVRGEDLVMEVLLSA